MRGYTRGIRLFHCALALLVAVAPCSAADEPMNPYESPKVEASAEDSFIETLESLSQLPSVDEKVDGTIKLLRDFLPLWRKSQVWSIPKQMTLYPSLWSVFRRSYSYLGNDVPQIDRLLRAVDAERLSRLDPYVLSRVLIMARLETLEAMRGAIPAGQERSAFSQTLNFAELQKTSLILAGGAPTYLPRMGIRTYGLMGLLTLGPGLFQNQINQALQGMPPDAVKAAIKAYLYGSMATLLVSYAGDGMASFFRARRYHQAQKQNQAAISFATTNQLAIDKNAPIWHTGPFRDGSQCQAALERIH